MQSVLVALSSAQDEDPLTEMEFKASLDSIMRNGAAFHPRIKRQGVPRYIRRGSGQRTSQAVWAVLKRAVGDDDRAKLRCLFRHMPSWEARETLDLTEEEYRQVVVRGEMRLPEPDASTASGTVASRLHAPRRLES